VRKRPFIHRGTTGRRPASHPPEALRPTTAKVRTAIFQILGIRVEGADVLDLFAGTGALGREALERGAATVAWVERDSAALRDLRPVEGPHARVIVSDYRDALDHFAQEGRRFTLAILDPPYGKGLALEALERLAQKGLVAVGGVAVAEHRRTDALPDLVAPPGAPVRLVRTSERRYGDTCVSFYSAEVSA